MKTRLFLLVFCLTSSSLLAGSSFSGGSGGDNSGGTAHGGIPFEFDATFSYISDGEVSRGRAPNVRDVDQLDEDYASARFVYTPRIKIGILRLGIAYERFGFSAPQLFEVPSGLQSISAVVGLDTELSDSILIRFEAQPGLYSGRSFEGRDFNVPFILGGTYIYNSNLQFVFGVSVDFDRNYPVFPGGGVRWRLGPQWVLNAVLPTPRLEYELKPDMTIYAGADLRGGNFRVNDTFGNERGNSRLDRAYLTYTEVRAGLGVEWKLAPEIKFALEGGYLPYREFDFHRTDVRYRFEDGGIYASASLNTAF